LRSPANRNQRISGVVDHFILTLDQVDPAFRWVFAQDDDPKAALSEDEFNEVTRRMNIDVS
jgi:hypothetical protein